MVRINTLSHDATLHSSNQHEHKAGSFVPEQQIHRFERAREFVRARNAAKLSRMFARPLVSHLNGHRDTPLELSVSGGKGLETTFVSGGADGELRVWDLSGMHLVCALPVAHNGFITGLCTLPDSGHLLSVGADRHVKMWPLSKWVSDPNEADEYSMRTTSRQVVSAANVFHQGISFDNPQGTTLKQLASRAQSTRRPIHDVTSQHDSTIRSLAINSSNVFATAGDLVKLWDAAHCVPKQEFNLDQLDSILRVKFSPIEHYLLGVTSRDRSIAIYDTRTSTLAQRFKMKLKSNDICFNPYNPFQFTIANEDTYSYTFDIRNVDTGPIQMHAGHVNAVTAIDYSPTGEEFVSAGYDKTIRIFTLSNTEYKSREVYHTQRMGRVQSVRFSSDGLFILSGSDDHGIRIWKTRPSDPLRVVQKHEKRQLEYNDALIERYKDFEEVSSIAHRRHLPRLVRSELKQINKSRMATLKKEKRIERYSKSRKAQALSKVNKPTAMRRFFLGSTLNK